MQRTKSRRRIGVGRGILLLLWPVAAATLLLARHSEAFAEQMFAQGIYPLYHRLLSLLPRQLPFSVAECLLCGLVPGVLVALILWGIHIIKARGRQSRILLGGMGNALCALGLVFFLFIFGCGVNYYRTPYAEAAGLEVSPSSPEELYGLCMELAQQAGELRESLSYLENEAGVLTLPDTTEALGQHAAQAMQAFGAENPLLSFHYSPPKPVHFSRVMSSFNITGIYFPFTGEANVNVEVPAYSLGATMCHELCHTAGFMREDEANYLAYLACTRYGDDVLAYSGTMLALAYSGNALHRVAPALYAQVYDCYTEGMLRDFRASSAYWAKFKDTTTHEIGEQMNDTYLKANNQPSGIQSYGAMVDLLLAEYKSRN